MYWGLFLCSLAWFPPSLQVALWMRICGGWCLLCHSHGWCQQQSVLDIESIDETKAFLDLSAAFCPSERSILCPFSSNKPVELLSKRIRCCSTVPLHRRDASFRIWGFKPGKSIIYPHVPVVGVTGVTPAGLKADLNSFQHQPLTFHLFPFPSIRSKKPQVLSGWKYIFTCRSFCWAHDSSAPYILLHPELVQVVSWYKGQQKGAAFSDA